MRAVCRVLPFLSIAILVAACSAATTSTAAPPPDRESMIPAEKVKQSPATDAHPPRSETPAYGDPVPLPYPVNTAGAEDSPFITPDGETLYFFFTPDVDQPVERQILDGVTGIYETHRVEGAWSKPTRVVLQDPGKLAGDGCEFVQGEVMWFCSVREGYTGIHWFTARKVDGVWQDWRLADFREEDQVGELHITADGQELYFHSARPGGRGGLDIWVMHREGDDWGTPENVAAVNTEQNEGWPFVSQDGSELWFTRAGGGPEIFRSLRVEGVWGAPERMFSSLAGEPTLDDAGRVYFVHHFFDGDTMLEADIYVAEPR